MPVSLRPHLLLLVLAWLSLWSANMVPAAELDLPLLVPSIITPLGRDSDGDGLPDVWERNGYTVDGVFVDLPGLGANPYRKDLFVWMDFMVRPSGTSLAPSQAVIDNIKAVFANAPVANPDGTTGITIHPLLKFQVPFAETLGSANDENKVWVDFDLLKTLHFPAAYATSFRYMIWANSYDESSSSGLARGIPATDFLVTLGLWSDQGGTDWEKLGTFVHELGHCLGLTHGGADHDNYKPNYLSVMNYFFQITGLYKNGVWGDTSQNPLLFDYQRLDTPTLDENNLNELAGLGSGVAGYGTKYYGPGSPGEYAVADASGSIDWNRDNAFTTGVAADINGDGVRSQLIAQNNWPHIDYSAGGLLGPAGTAAARAQADA
ncbi:MAG TPA: hypothetical protein PKC79_21560, partial [Solidesulfovibrio magneticus]|nr:hypothetical protein [Solidesulfovibrio magneticus]